MSDGTKETVRTILLTDLEAGPIADMLLELPGEIDMLSWLNETKDGMDTSIAKLILEGRFQWAACATRCALRRTGVGIPDPTITFGTAGFEH